MVAGRKLFCLMPSRPKTFCIQGCAGQSVNGSRLCQVCFDVREEKILARNNKLAKARTEKYGSSREQGYDWRWEKLSKFVRRNEPVCRICKNALAQMVDHIVPLKQGGERLAMENLQPLCNRCHGAKTAQDKLHYTNLSDAV
jgi:5-methylcytosine-specific restriction enzyme A